MRFIEYYYNGQIYLSVDTIYVNHKEIHLKKYERIPESCQRRYLIRVNNSKIKILRPFDNVDAKSLFSIMCLLKKCVWLHKYNISVATFSRVHPRINCLAINVLKNEMYRSIFLNENEIYIPIKDAIYIEIFITIPS